jgi:hypothetical protein
MIGLSNILAIARAETRLTRRLVRYWVFQGIALLAGLGIYAYYIWIHWNFSSYSATAAIINPRYLVGFMGIYYLVIFLIGLIFLGFDVRARDVRERMGEVLDSRPFTNIEMLLGKYVGIMTPAWIPVAVVSLLFVLVGLPFNESIEPLSLFTFAVPMTIPAYTFVLGITFLLTLLLKHRLLAGVAATLLVVGLIVVNFGLVPIWLLPAVDITGGFSVLPPSDLIPKVLDRYGLAQRSGVLLLGLGMIWLAAALHPRRDDSPRSLTLGVGSAMLAAGLALVLVPVIQARGILEQRAAWRAAHEARSLDPAPDLLKLSGDVTIDPARLTMELELTLMGHPGDAPLDSALFTLNPGLAVSSARDAQGSALEFEQRDGLLDIRLARPLEPGRETTIALSVEGSPDSRFAYLEAAFDPLELNIREGNIFILGFESLIYESRFAALLPGTRWLPTAGAEIGRGDPEVRPADFFNLDVTVRVPEDWLVAGPGRREEVPGETGAFRFRPAAPVPGVALIGSRYVSRSTEVDGVLLEALLAPEHEEALDFFGDATEPLREWFGERLEEVREVGLDYPYEALTLVEVPGLLRGYAGGWRMDTTLTQPSMVLVREAGFPTARFDTKYSDAEQFEDQEGGLPAAKIRALQRFFETDFSGGNPFVAAARSFFTFQTAASGYDGVPMDFVWEDLSTRLVTDRRGYFSIHHYGSDMNATINASVTAIFRDRGSGSVAETIIRSITSRPDVWDAVLSASLADLDPWEAPKRALDVLTLKGGAMAQSLIDGLGRSRSGQLLATLRAAKQGQVYTRDDVVQAGLAIDAELAPWLDVWIDTTALPGFIVRDVQLDRIRDSEDGAPRYQTMVLMQNAEAATGMLRMHYSTSDEDDAGAKGSTEPIRIDGESAVEIGIVSSKPPIRMRVEPYLSMNREPFRVSLPVANEEIEVDQDPFVGIRVVEWEQPDDGTIVVDDLDGGFDVLETGERSMLRVGSGASADDDEETDAGLPIYRFGRAPKRWSRRGDTDAWGRYRHTVALAKAGDGDRRAVFNAEIPASGPYEVAFHLPTLSPRQRERLGTFQMRLVDSSGEHELTLDAAAGENGWNPLEVLELAAGEVRVEVSNETDGRYVIADAIRLRPTKRSGGALASR